MTELTYTFAGERPRSTKKFRVGFRPNVAVTIRGETETFGNLNRRQKTPLEQVQEDLAKNLENYNVSDVLKRELVSEVVRLDTVTTMNMSLLAATLVYLNSFPDVLDDPEYFTDDNLDLYLNTLMNNFTDPVKGTAAPSAIEIAEVRYKYKQSMLRYIRKIVALRLNRQALNDNFDQVGLQIEEEEIEE